VKKKSVPTKKIFSKINFSKKTAGPKNIAAIHPEKFPK